MATVVMLFQVSSVASKFTHINHNLRISWQTQPPKNLHPGQWGYTNPEPENQKDDMEVNTMRPGRGWTQRLKVDHSQHALICHYYPCMKIPNRDKDGQKYIKEKRGGHVYIKIKNTVDGRIRML